MPPQQAESSSILLLTPASSSSAMPMPSVPSKRYSNDVSLVVVFLNANPLFWATGAASGDGNHPSSILPFVKFLDHMIPFLKSLLLLNQINRVVLIATGINSYDYIYDSGSGGSGVCGMLLQVSSKILKRLGEFVDRDRKLGRRVDRVEGSSVASLLFGSLSLALFYIQRVFWSGEIHTQPRILCLHASQDRLEQYVAVMNVIFSTQHSMFLIDSCVVGVQHSAFLQQASYIIGGVYLKPP